ncbi:MAG: HDOD domain-containing protein [Desulfovibrionaceae bacterium]|jgi:HD-like signal output (HDOD) protein/ActR/RegA family two-component response regulator|nr:HDOD domain-containing protein [Desulfovibrionaceae bacterium]
MKKKILFVDDDRPVLDGFRLMLRSRRKEWELSFAQSGEEALELLAEQPADRPVDVIVADLRMRGMGGAVLLEQVQERWPGTLRVVLSGYSDMAATLKVVRAAHQFLAKPCSSEELTGVLARILNLRGLLVDRQVLRHVGRLGALPALPDVYVSIMEELASPEPAMDRLGAIVSRDPGVSASLLKLVNSAFFGLFGTVTNPARAVMLLGTETLKGVVLGAHLLSRFSDERYVGYSLERVGAHSYRCGGYARALAATESKDKGFLERCMLAGLLHDVGKLLLAQDLWADYMPVIEAVRERGRPLFELEREMLGVDHAVLGAYLLGVWGMAEETVQAVLAHHDLSRDPGRGFTPAVCAHAANALDHELNVFSDERTVFPMDIEALRARGLDARVDAWRGACCPGAEEADF